MGAAEDFADWLALVIKKSNSLSRLVTRQNHELLAYFELALLEVDTYCRTALLDLLIENFYFEMFS